MRIPLITRPWLLTLAFSACLLPAAVAEPEPGEGSAGAESAEGKLQEEVRMLRAEIRAMKKAVAREAEANPDDHVRRMERVNLNLTAELNQQLKSADELRGRLREMEERVKGMKETETMLEKARQDLEFSRLESEGLQMGLQRLQVANEAVERNLQTMQQLWLSVSAKARKSAESTTGLTAILPTAPEPVAQLPADGSTPRAEVIAEDKQPAVPGPVPGTAGPASAPASSGTLVCTIPCSGSDEAVAEAYDAAVAAVRGLLEQQPAARLTVKGYWPEDPGISLKRAQRVADYLTRRGVGRNQMDVIAGPDGAHAIRRVEILVN